MSGRGRIRGLLFDKDGTLLDFDRTWVPINRELALYAAKGDGDLRDELLRIGGHDPLTNRLVPGSTWAAAGLGGIIGMLAEHLGGRAPNDLYATGERLFREGGAKYSALIDGVAAALAEYERCGLAMGIATNDTEAGIQSSLERHDVLHFFRFRAGCDSGHGAKPEPGMVLAFARAMELETADVAVIGDSIHDLETAQRAKAGRRIAVLSGTSGHADLAPHADAVLDSVADVAGLLKAIGHPPARKGR